MKSKLFVTAMIVVLLLAGLASQVFAAGANTDQKSILLAARTSTRTSTRTATKSPVPTRTRTPTLTPVPSITGSVLIHGGACCMGGTVGTTINIDIAFSATSIAGAVSDMRVGNSCTQDLSTVAWEPYVTSKTVAYKIIAVNWVGFYTSVQYRDVAGNISPTYCDDISIEGSPALTPGTGTPTLITPTKTPTATSSAIPGADFVGTPLSGAAPLTVQFTALNSSNLKNCVWNFGDGTSQSYIGAFSVCPATTHTYTSGGSYTVSLSVQKGTGMGNTMTKTNYIQVTGTSATLTPTGTITPTKTPSKTPIITGT